MKNVAVLGGAFDPVHLDHIRVAKTCLEKGFCDEVWFMPSPDRWDKKLNASPEDRFAMLELAMEGDPRLILSDLEIQQGDFRGSYVFLCGLKEKFPDINFRLLTGADTYEGIPHWRDPMHFFGTNYNGHLLLRDIELIVLARNGYPRPDIGRTRRRAMQICFGLDRNRASRASIRVRLFVRRSCVAKNLRDSTRKCTSISSSEDCIGTNSEFGFRNYE